MQLLANARAEDIHTYGCDELLQTFVDHIKLLCEVHLLFLLLNLTVFRIMVVELEIDGQPITIHGPVVCVCGDTPASNF